MHRACAGTELKQKVQALQSSYSQITNQLEDEQTTSMKVCMLSAMHVIMYVRLAFWQSLVTVRSVYTLWQQPYL